MKKSFLSLLVVAAAMTGSFSAAAQTVFAPLGAEWWYNFVGLGSPPVSYTRVRAVGDSAVGGYLARKLLLEAVFDTGAGIQVDFLRYWFVRTAGDDVFRWNAATGTYHLEFSFGRAVGDVWNAAGCFGSFTPLVLDSVQQTVVGGVPLRRQFYGFPNQPGRGYIPAFERVGTLGGPNVIFQEPWCGPGAQEGSYGFVSYSDSLVQIGPAPVLGHAEPFATTVLSVAPNPSVTGRFHLEGLPNKLVSYVVFDAQGRRIRAGQLTAAAPEINLAAEPAGLYLLRGEVGGKAFTRRLIR